MLDGSITTRPELQYNVKKVEKADEMNDELLEILGRHVRKHEQEAFECTVVIVYVQRTMEAEQLRDQLKARFRSAQVLTYHGQMPFDERDDQKIKFTQAVDGITMVAYIHIGRHQ